LCANVGDIISPSIFPAKKFSVAIDFIQVPLLYKSVLFDESFNSNYLSKESYHEVSHVTVGGPLVLGVLVEVGEDDVVDQPPETETLVSEQLDHEQRQHPPPVCPVRQFSEVIYISLL